MEDKQIRSQIRERLKRLARPTTEKDLLKQLRLKGGDRQAAKRVIEEMVAKGELVRTHADRIGLPEKMDVVAGRLEVKRGGFGFVVPNERGLQDVYVAGPNLADALHGDRVLVHIERTGHEGKPEGRIVRVLERRTTAIVGRLEVDAGGTRVAFWRSPPFKRSCFRRSFSVVGRAKRFKRSRI